MLAAAAGLLVALGSGFPGGVWANDGDILWTYTVDGFPGTNLDSGEEAFAIAPAAGGIIVVVGTRSTTGQGLDCWVQKLNPSPSSWPTVVWTMTINGSVNNDENGYAVAVDTVSPSSASSAPRAETALTSSSTSST